MFGLNWEFYILNISIILCSVLISYVFEEDVGDDVGVLLHYQILFRRLTRRVRKTERETGWERHRSDFVCHQRS